MDLADVGAVVWVGQLAHGGLADAEPAGEVHFGDALGALIAECRASLAATTAGTSERGL